MLVAERHREIMNLLELEGSIRVTELAKLFRVTEETVRRDLEKLETDNKLLRSHGGAVMVKASERETPYSEREINHLQEKIAIAKEAVKRVEEGDTILLDASTTAWQMAKLLPDLRMTVLTNAIKVAVELADRTRIRVIATGGTLSAPSLSFTGPLAERTIKQYHVNKLFFSCKGVDFERGLSDSNETQAMLKHRMMAIADQSFLLADSSKFGVKALSMFSDLELLHEIITDDRMTTSNKSELLKRQIPYTMVNANL